MAKAKDLEKEIKEKEAREEALENITLSEDTDNVADAEGDFRENEKESSHVETDEASLSGEESADENPEDASSEKKGSVKKDKTQEKIDELNDRLMRQMAEFENFRKRTEKEKAQMFETGAKSIIEKILPVVDNFERGLGAVPDDGEKNSFEEGMEMVYKQLMNELEGLGVTPIEAVGKEFDPEFHNAVMQEASEEFESGIVSKELLKGYMYRESVVRHSMVAVVE